jgi:hypothetical protein
MGSEWIHTRKNLVSTLQEPAASLFSQQIFVSEQAHPIDVDRIHDRHVS